MTTPLFTFIFVHTVNLTVPGQEEVFDPELSSSLYIEKLSFGKNKYVYLR